MVDTRLVLLYMKNQFGGFEEVRKFPYHLICGECGRPYGANNPNRKTCSSVCSRLRGSRIQKDYYSNKPGVPVPDEYGVLDKQTFCGNCCDVFKSHAEILKDDPERLSTDFIKKLSQCRCDEV